MKVDGGLEMCIELSLKDDTSLYCCDILYCKPACECKPLQYVCICMTQTKELKEIKKSSGVNVICLIQEVF